MRSYSRIVRYTLEAVAAAVVLLIPAGCDLESLTTLASTVTQPPGDDVVDGGTDDLLEDDEVVPTAPGEDINEGAQPPPDTVPVDDGEADGGESSDSPADEAPADEPPADSPPADEPQGDDPPADDPPDDNPPVDEPPADDPPADEPPREPGDVPDNEYCADLADWPTEWIVFEEDVLALVNQHRAAGADCGSQGEFAATGSLTMSPALRCAARSHSMDMNLRDFFSHINPDGDGPAQRLGYAGYDGSGWGENIAWGYPSPAAVVAGWMGSDGHCANIMRPQYTSIGVGYYEGNYWTQTFGSQ